MTTQPTIEEHVSRMEGGQEHLATKADVESLRVDLERIRSEFKEEMGSLRSEFMGEIGKLRAEIRDSKISTIIWIAGIMAALLGSSIVAQRIWPV